MKSIIGLIAVLLFYFILVIYFTGCGPNKETYTFIDGEFSPYVSEFNTLSGQPPYNVIIQFGVRIDAAGTCEVQQNGQLVINISRPEWDSYCIEQRRGVIFHELGHCVLARSHTLDSMSYMYPSVQTCEFYMSNIPALDDELFN